MITRRIWIALALPCAFIQSPAPSDAQGKNHIALESRSTGRGYAICGSCTVPRDITSRLSLAPADEPGDRVILSGIIYKSDGVTPDSGVTLFVYQADAGGYYHRPKEDVFHPRLFGWLRTSGDGKYEIRTVKPAPEILAPREPAHIHVHVFGPGMEEHFLHEFWFQGDERISHDDLVKCSALGTFSPIVKLRKGDDGIQRGVRNIRIKPAPHWRYEEN